MPTMLEYEELDELPEDHPTVALANRMRTVPGYREETVDPVYLQDIEIGAKVRLWMLPCSQLFFVGPSRAGGIIVATERGQLTTFANETACVIVTPAPIIHGETLQGLTQLLDEVAAILAGIANPGWGDHPSEQGLYWWWSDDESIPIPVSLLWSGTGRNTFAPSGQHGWTRSQPVEEMGGKWMPLYDPMSPFTDTR